MIRDPRMASAAPKSLGLTLLFVHTALVDVRLQLERIRRRVQLSAFELELQPEAFQATEELRIASGELTSVIEDLEGRAEVGVRAGSRLFSFRSRSSDLADGRGAR
jgi:hypothetical protein